MEHGNGNTQTQPTPRRRVIAAGYIRRAPRPLALTCCGTPMRRDGTQYVCGKCGAWTEGGR
ncbi:hypothetical protein [Streptomyces acidiscabies]|uniref:hypothetical protein n=1 Tax=Streptomyces acidiscabies TaxID=42234 RepID=UPI00095360FE|nr:hypothetical protein [Streptomyces acidiscabies]